MYIYELAVMMTLTSLKNDLLHQASIVQHISSCHIYLHCHCSCTCQHLADLSAEKRLAT